MISYGLFYLLISIIIIINNIECKSPTPSNEKRSYFDLTSSNGHGTILYNSTSNSIFAMLDHPYKFIRAPKDLVHEMGIERRNLALSFRIGLIDSVDNSTE